MEEDNFFKRIVKAARNQYKETPKRSTHISYGGLIDYMDEIKKIKDKEDYYRIFLDIPAVRGAVDAIVNAVTGNGYRIRTLEKQDVEEGDSRLDELRQWLDHPSKDFYSILRTVVTNLIVSDDSFIELKSNEMAGEGTSGWMWPLDNRYVKIHLDKDKKAVSHIVYNTATMSAKGTKLGPEKYVHASMNKLGSSLYGISSIESLVKLANLYNYSTAYNTALFESGGIPAIVFTMLGGLDSDFERLIAMLEEAKTGRSLGLFGDIRIDKIGVTSQDINFQGIFEHVTQMVMTVFQVPPVMMSLQGASTKETSKSEMNAFGGKVRSVQWMVNNIVSQMIHKIWGEQYEDIFFSLNPWHDPATLSAIHKIYLATGVLTPNDVRKELDLPPVKWGDAPYNPNFPHPDTGLLPPDTEGKPGAGGTQTGASSQSPSGNTDTERPTDRDKDKPKKDLGYYLDELNIKAIARAMVTQYDKIYEETSTT